MTRDDARSRLRHFLRQSLNKPQLGDQDSIFTVGEASSLFTLELVLFIEEELGTALQDEDLERETFETIESLSDLVVKRQTSP
jgi:acyl carrier protein